MAKALILLAVLSLPAALVAVLGWHFNRLDDAQFIAERYEETSK